MVLMMASLRGLALQPTVGSSDQSNYQKPAGSETRRHRLPAKIGTRRLRYLSHLDSFCIPCLVGCSCSSPWSFPLRKLLSERAWFPLGVSSWNSSHKLCCFCLSLIQRFVLLLLYAFTESSSRIWLVWARSVSVVLVEKHCGEEILFRQTLILMKATRK